MQRLVDDLLLLARLDGVSGPRHSTVDIGEVARAAVDALRRLTDNLLANVRTHTPLRGRGPGSGWRGRAATARC